MNVLSNYENLRHLSAEDYRSCEAICLAVNRPWDENSGVRESYPSFASIHSIMNSLDGEKLIFDLIEAIRGQLDSKDFVIKICTLLACYRAKEQARYFRPLANGNYLLEFDKLLHHKYNNTQLIGETLERVVFSTIRSLGNHYPDLVNNPGLLPIQVNVSSIDSISSRPLDIYCCIRSLVPFNHMSLLRRVCEISESLHDNHLTCDEFSSNIRLPFDELNEESELESSSELDEETDTDFQPDSLDETEESDSASSIVADFVIGDDRGDSDDSWEPDNVVEGN